MLVQGQQALSAKGKIVNIFGFVSHSVPRMMTLPL